jgi:hypothetical protein
MSRKSQPAVLRLGQYDPQDEARADRVADVVTATCRGLVAEVGIKGILDGLMSVYVTLSMQHLGEAATRATLKDVADRLAGLLRAHGQAPKRSA